MCGGGDDEGVTVCVVMMVAQCVMMMKVSQCVWW